MILPNRATLIVAGIAVIALSIAAAIAHYWKGRAEDWQGKYAQAQAAFDSAASANESNQALIAEQRLAIQTWKQRAFHARALTDAALKYVEDTRAQLNAANARLNAEESKDDDLPECQKLLAVDLSAACPAHSRGLFERATGGGEN